MSATQPYLLDPAALAGELSTDLVNGLSESEARQRLDQFGLNSIRGKGSKNPLLILLAQFKSALVLLLIVAAGLSFFFRDWLDGIAILAVILINAVIGFLMEYQAERSMEALKKLASTTAKVIRDGNMKEINSEHVVPGDILFAEAGDIALADGRIVQLAQFQVDESTLTGESVPVEKQVQQLSSDVPLPERANMAYKGTFVVKGNARILVTGTGMNSELGKIAGMVQQADQAETPLEKRLEDFSKRLIVLTVILVVLIFIGGMLNGQKLVNMLETSIALAVAAVPEGLPIVATLALAQGVMRMAKHNVIVKKLAAVESLGGATVICTDKTGTLTQNRMTVEALHAGTPSQDGKNNAAAEQLLLKIAVLCNTAVVTRNGEEWEETGDPLETALLRYAAEHGTDPQEVRRHFPKISEEPFSSETKMMATVHTSDDHFFIAAKGAVEELLKHCTHSSDENGISPMGEATRKAWLSRAEQLAASGLRLVGLAYREVENVPEPLSSDLVFAGIAGLLDPPRAEAAEAIAQCHNAGIKVIMITGDHPATARNIAHRLGIIRDEKDGALHGAEMGEFETLRPDMRERWLSSRVFARMSPKQKLDLVRFYQEENETVGMTGDGVNDAPALKKADIGIAMGKRGNQVAQEVADMVIKDDSFSSIVLAIRQGRIIFENIRKFVIYLLSCNLSELFVIAVAAVLNLNFQLVPLQILFINLVTDVLPALALGVTEGNEGIMHLRPRKSGEPIIDRNRWRALIVYAVVITGCVIGSVFVSHELLHSHETMNPEMSNNVMFFTLIFSQLFHVFNMNRDVKAPFFRSEIIRNKFAWYAVGICIFITLLFAFIPPLAKVLHVFSLSWKDWTAIVSFSLLSSIVIHILKKFKFIL